MLGLRFVGVVDILILCIIKKFQNSIIAIPPFSI
jgi:hypothetical protein